MPSPPKIASSTGNGRSLGGSGGIRYTEQNPNAEQGAAPAGKTFGSDLPVQNSPSSATTGGYRPNNNRG